MVEKVDFVIAFHHTFIRDKDAFIQQDWSCVVVEAPGENIMTHGDFSI